MGGAAARAEQNDGGEAATDPVVQAAEPKPRRRLTELLAKQRLPGVAAGVVRGLRFR